MTGSSFICMLLLFISSNYSFTIHTREFTRNVHMFGDIVKDCPDNCSSVRTNEMCQCFNMTLPQGECGFLTYYIKGLNSLHSLLPSLNSRQTVQNLIEYLNSYNDSSNNLGKGFCSNPVNYLPVISPKGLHKRLEELKDSLNSKKSDM